MILWLWLYEEQVEKISYYDKPAPLIDWYFMFILFCVPPHIFKGKLNDLPLLSAWVTWWQKGKGRIIFLPLDIKIILFLSSRTIGYIYKCKFFFFTLIRKDVLPSNLSASLSLLSNFRQLAIAVLVSEQVWTIIWGLQAMECTLSSSPLCFSFTLSVILLACKCSLWILTM